MESLGQKYESLRRALVLVSQEPSESVAKKVLEEVVLDTIKRYQEKVNVGLEDSVSDLIGAFKQQITDRVFDIAAEWKIANSGREPCIFPRSCRFAYQRGTSSIFVIEQDPQVRSLMFGRGLLKEKQRIPLAMPYAVFVIHFREQIYSGLHVAWMKKPLSSINDQMYIPVLSNIHKNSYQVCTGFERLETWRDKEMGKVSEEVVSNFWNSTFNKDLPDNLLKGLKESGLVSLPRWIEKSEQDPMFILKMRFIAGRTLKEVIELLTLSEETPDESQIRNKIIAQINESSSSLFHKILKYFKKNKFEAHYPKTVIKSSQKALEEIMKEYSKILMDIELEMQKIKEQINAETKSFSKGGFWEEYRS